MTRVLNRENSLYIRQIRQKYVIYSIKMYFFLNIENQSYQTFLQLCSNVLINLS